MRDPFHGEQQFVGVLVLAAEELAPVVREDRPEGDAQRLVEGQDAVVEEVTGGDGHLGGVDLREGEGAEDVDHDLDVDLADALEGAPVERVLVEQLARARVASTCSRARGSRIPAMRRRTSCLGSSVPGIAE